MSKHKETKHMLIIKIPDITQKRLYVTRSVEMRHKSHREIFRERPKTELKLISAQFFFIAENESSKSLLSCV